MPMVSIPAGLWEKIFQDKKGKKEVDEVAFGYGIELDETEHSGAPAPQTDENLTAYKFETAANRYDLLCAEAIMTCLRVYHQKEPAPVYKLTPPQLVMKVDSSTKDIRPYVACAVLRDITWDKDGYESFISMQEKLHGNLCKKRKVVSIGTHNLDTIKAPFTYLAQARKDIRFVPLSTQEEVTAEGDPNTWLRKDLVPYTKIIEAFEQWPVIRDAEGRVLSLPPIINGEHSKISEETKNIFIEITAIEKEKALVVLDQIICGFSVYCKDKYSIEQVTVDYGEGNTEITPRMETWKMKGPVKDLVSMIGVDIPAEQLPELLSRMSLPTVLVGEDLEVTVPPNRTDIMHWVDVVEDAAISYGYDKIKANAKPVPTLSEGVPQARNELARKIRTTVGLMGYTEMLAWSMNSTADGFDGMRIQATEAQQAEQAVLIANPRTMEFQMCRNRLLPGLLKCLCANQASPLPIRLFEVQDVVVNDKSEDVGARNRRHCGILLGAKATDIAAVQGVAMHVFKTMGLDKEVTERKSDLPWYLPNRAIVFYVGETEVGSMGIVHPDVLQHHQLGIPTTYAEIDIEALEEIVAARRA